jgi:hypothetical protein
MAKAAIGLLSDNARLEQLRTAARRTAQKRFCSTLVLPQYVEFYEGLLATV